VIRGRAVGRDVDLAVLLMRWDRLVKAVAERLGTKADSVFDLPRMLRVPGSYNCKGSSEGSRSDTRGAADAQHIRAPGLKQWGRDRWTRQRLTDQNALSSAMLVTAFGHGRHSCPAQPFSLAAMTAATTHLLREYHRTPGWSSHPQPLPARMGGVARAEGPCLVDYVAS
jgi:hypothetical protein